MTRLRLGQCVITMGAAEAFDNTSEEPGRFLYRHARGDWGDLDPFDKEQNDQAVERGERVLSAYHLKTGVKFWIITEADRSSTTILLPTEY